MWCTSLWPTLPISPLGACLALSLAKAKQHWWALRDISIVLPVISFSDSHCRLSRQGRIKGGKGNISEAGHMSTSSAEGGETPS